MPFAPARQASLALLQLQHAGSTPALDFALYQPASIAGSVYEDDDADATRDGGEGGLAGRTVYVDVNDDGDLDAGLGPPNRSVQDLRSVPGLGSGYGR